MRKAILWAAVMLWAATATGGNQDEASKGRGGVSFKRDIAPLIARQCLPCHAEEQFNPSELSLDTYDLLMTGGKHGTPVTPGKAAESILVRKLLPRPPFGDRMPLDPKKKKGEESTKRLSEEEIRLISDWIDQGARNN